MKRLVISLVLIFAAAWVWCNFGSASGAHDSNAAVGATNSAPVNLAAEIAGAKAGNKLLFLEFGSSDSCPPCIAFQKEVFSKPEFLAYEKTNLDFVRLDFPLQSSLPPDTKATNTLLAQQFGAYAFPTFIALDRDGKEFWRMPAKDDSEPTIDTRLFQPEAFIKLLESVKKKEK